MQPRSSIFELFDDLLLLSEGAVVYDGPAAGVAEYFAALGHPCPQFYNPAEFLADLISIDTSSPEAELESRCDGSREGGLQIGFSGTYTILECRFITWHHRELGRKMNQTRTIGLSRHCPTVMEARKDPQ